MYFFKNWILTICVVTIAVTLIEMLITSDKMNKIINLLLGAFFIISVIAPLKNLKFEYPKERYKLENSISESFSETVKSQSTDLCKNNIKNLIDDLLKKKGISAQKIKVFMDTTEDNCISISKAQIFIDKGFENRGEEIKNLVEKNFEIKTDIVISGCD